MGFREVLATGLLTNNHVLRVQAELERNDAGFRRLPGTTVQDGHGRMVYTPPEQDRMLTAVEETAREAIVTIRAIREAFFDYKHRIRARFRFYSQDLINNLFTHPYTKIQFVEQDLEVSRLTATKYLDALTEGGFLLKRKVGRSNYYINLALVPILTGDSLGEAPPAE